MNPDLKTVILFNTVGSLLISLGLYTISRGHLGQIWEIKRWALTVLIQGVGWIFLGILRGVIPDFASIILGNGFILFSQAMSFNILASFLNVKIKSYFSYITIAVGVFFIGYFELAVSDITMRIIFLSICSSFIFSSSSFILFKFKNREFLSHIFTGLIYAVCGVVSGIRAAYYLFCSTNSSQSFFEKNLMQDISYVVLIPFY